MLSNTIAGVNTIHTTPLREDIWKIMPPFSWTPPHTLVSFADFNLYPVTVINCKCKYKRVSEFCEFFYQIIKPEDNLGGSLHCL